MLTPFLKAQLVALLTKKLLDTPAFVSGVAKLHNNFSVLQEGAYDALLKATEDNSPTGPQKLKEGTMKSTVPPRREELKEQAGPKRATPRATERAAPPKAGRSQDQGLLDFIARTKKDLESQAKR